MSSNMPRISSNKSYGREGQKDSFASRAFDAVLLSGGTKANKAASTIKRWGNTSFTSTRGTSSNIDQSDNTARKRKMESPAPDPDSMFDDPFSFDSDDDSAPKKPKRGMGYKNEDHPPAKPAKTPGSSVLERDENNEEKDSITNAPSRTYSKSIKHQKLDNGKQLSLEACFAAKQSKPLNSATSSSSSSASQVQNVPRKFFTSRSGSSKSNISDNIPMPGRTKEKSTPPSSSLNFFDDIKTAEDEDVVSKKVENLTGSSQAKKRVTSRTECPIVLSGKSDYDDNDTDSISSQRSLKADCSQHSIASNGSSSSICDSLKWDNRPVIKISSLDRGDKGTKESSTKPLVRRLLTSPKKTSRLIKKASYNPRQWHDSDDEISSSQDASVPRSSAGAFDFDGPEDDDAVLPSKDARIRKTMKPPARPGFDRPVTKVNINKEHKPLYTVVRNVKQAHECQEYGETQEFQDDIDYIMDGLNDQQSPAIRCLSAMTLTNKCVSSAFRMHLRAHGILDSIFGKLHNAYKFPNLALATASLMYFVSRDRFSMDLDPGTLELMVKLLDEGDDNAGAAEGDSDEFQRMQGRIGELCQQLQNDSCKVDVRMDEVSIGLLAMETLLSLTSKRAGEWFKEELRTLGGLEHIVNTVSECVADLDEFVIDPTEAMLNRLKKIERCLRVLENVTYLNPDNQRYLTNYKKCSMLKDLCHTLRVCENCLPFNPVEVEKGKTQKDCPGYIIFSCLLAVLRVLLNITHDNPYGSTKAGQQEQLLKTVLIAILRVPQYIPSEESFDILVLGLGLLINLVEHCDHNRELLIDTQAVQPYDEHATYGKVSGPMESLEALAKLFLIRYEAGRRIEEEHDARLDEKEQQKKEQRQQAKQAHNKSGEWKESGAGLEWIAGDTTAECTDLAVLPGGGSAGEDVGDGDGDGAAADRAASDHESEGEEATDFTEALHKAGKHMEGCILAAYVALLIGCTIQGNSEHIERVRNCLPEGEFEPMVRMLRKFLGFMNFTSCISGSSGSKSIKHIIEVLEAC